jgi:protein-L-isoaspartate(D-aspartate) O-methyltransferase
VSRAARPRFPLSLAQLPSAAPGDGQRALQRPQRPLRDAVRDGALAAGATGVGLDSDAVRQCMVQRLRAGGISDERVLAAFAAVPRHRFVDTALVNQAYEDTSLPIGFGQTISKPAVIARMLVLVCERHAAGDVARPLARVLEIGTGCGYQAALLAQLARSVISIERLQPLHEKARENLVGLRRHNLRLVFGDGRHGHAPNAPYDTIIAAAGGDELPQSWLEQLADGGRLIAPVHDAASGGQRLLLVDRDGERLSRRWLDAVHFVPLKSGTQ